MRFPKCPPQTKRTWSRRRSEEERRIAFVGNVTALYGNEPQKKAAMPLNIPIFTGLSRFYGKLRKAFGSGRRAMINAGTMRTVQNWTPNSWAKPIALADIQSPTLKIVIESWQKWRGAQTMPSRQQLTLQDLRAATGHISLARVLDGDYEFRVIGDVHVRAYGVNYQGKRLSDVIANAPTFGESLKVFYDAVRLSGRPRAIRGVVGDEMADVRFTGFETCCLPLGHNGVVDHIINAAVYC